ncbi:MAG: hypothetical protein Q4D81_11260 [Eubacteriales bacterium]|nr:hypothetical protein [Eubacteriales bacterium]
MAEYDLKRLEVAIQYIRRMADGRNPVTNRPAPENEVLSNANVNRCLKFVEEILRDVHSAGGKVGALPRKERAARINVAETFPYEILKKYHYERDQQISYFLNQLAEELPEGETMPVGAVRVNNWLRDNGYLEKRLMQETGNENTVPTEKGMAIGIYMEKAGMPPREYYRIYYNEQAQRFLVDNFRRILTEEEEKSALKKARRQKEKDDLKWQKRQENRESAEQRAPYGQQAPQGRDVSRPSGDPAFDSLVASLSYDYGDSLYSQGNSEAPDPGFSVPDFMGDGWESVDGEGLPW